jgi:small subunit ribosomal protein S8
MNVTDPIADMLTRIRNALMAHKPSVSVPGSKLKLAIAELLREEGYVDGVAFEDDTQQGYISLTLRYWQDQIPAIAGLRRVSSPGRRIYVKASDIPKVLGGLGICILSTSKGILTGYEAARQNVGGELLCEVW